MKEQTTSSFARGGSFLLEDTDPQSVFTPEDFSSEERSMAQAARDFLEKEVIPQQEKLEEKEPGLMEALARKAGELGFLGMEVPEAYGGLGMQKTVACLIEEEIGRYASFAVTCGTHTGIGTLPITYFGSEELKARYLPKLASGEWLGAYALTEADAGSDALSLRTRATQSEDGAHYLLNGTKMWISNAGFAQTFIIMAKVDGEKHAAFVIDRDLPGFSIEKEEHKLGIRGSSTCRVVLEDCKVPKENLLGEVGKGHLIAFNVLNMGRLKLGAGTLGAAKQILRTSATYATERKQFGRPIGQFGLIQQKLAEMARRIFATESILYRTAGLMNELDDRGEISTSVTPNFPLYVEEYAIESSVIKVTASEDLDTIADEGLQIYGGYGYSEEFPLARAYRDARINRIFEGTNEINRLFIPAMLMRRAERGRLPLMEAISRVQKELIELSPLGAPAPEDPIEKTATLIGNIRRLLLFLAGVAYQRYGNNLLEEQEVLAGLAEGIMELYKLESVLLRSRKVAGKGDAKRSELQKDILALQLEDTMERLQSAARRLLPRVAQGDDLRGYSGVVRRLLKSDPVDTINLGRKVGQAVYDAQRYPL